MRTVVKTSMELISCHLWGGMWHQYHRLHGRAVWLGERRESGTTLRLWKGDSSSDRSFPFIFIPFCCLYSQLSCRFQNRNQFVCIYDALHSAPEAHSSHSINTCWMYEHEWTQFPWGGELWGIFLGQSSHLLPLKWATWYSRCFRH